MYIDGVKKATTTQPANSDQVIEFLNGGKLTIGSDKDGNNAFSGQIDHFHIRNLAVYKIWNEEGKILRKHDFLPVF